MTGGTALQAALDREGLRRMAGARSFGRGEKYFAAGRVRSLIDQEGTVTGKVHGRREYRIKLWGNSGGLHHSCTCPVGAEGRFCKHCVAVGLAWLKGNDPAGGTRKECGLSTVTMEDVRVHLGSKDKEALVDIVIDLAMEDDGLRRRLLMTAAGERPRGPDLATYRSAIDEAVGKGDFVGYREMYGYVRGIDEVIDAVERVLKDGHAHDVIELAEHALASVEEAMGSADDSDGQRSEILERVQNLHLRACKEARPDPGALVERLFAWQIRSEWGTFDGAAETYAEVLGQKGLAIYRRLAEARWAQVPALVPGDDDPEKYGTRLRITRIMEAMERQAGDVEDLIAVKERDLSSAYAFLDIAETCRKAGQGDRALEWAERGVKAFPEQTDARLREFLAEEYLRRKRKDEAMALVWDGFAGTPNLLQYRNLKKWAGRIRRWPAWRKKALAFLRQRIKQEKGELRSSPWGRWRRADHSEFVRIFLWEGDNEAAWREAREGGCSDDLWLQLADRRQNTRPEDALPIYQARIEPTLEEKNDEAYRACVDLLRKIRTLMARLGREPEFAPYLEEVCRSHRRKRNFIKLLDQASWK